LAPLFSGAALHADAEPAASTIRATVSTQAETLCGDPITYTVSMEGLQDTGTITLSFVVDTAGQSLDTAKAVAPLNGFTTLSLKWSDPVGGLRTGTIVLMYPGFVSSPSPLDVLSIATTALDKAGEASITISGLEITGNVNGMSDYQASAIIVGKATTSVVDKKQTYSKYDLNKDGKIDTLDRDIAVHFYMKSSGAPGWETEVFERATAKEADVNNSGRVDMADLIEIMANARAS